MAKVITSIQVERKADQTSRVVPPVKSGTSTGLGGLFVAGILTRKATAPGMMVGFFASGVVLYLISTSGAIHFFLFGGVGMLNCVVLGWLASRILLAFVRMIARNEDDLRKRRSIHYCRSETRQEFRQ